MSFSFCSLSSGSSGNCYLVRSENTALLVDGGISARRVFSGLAQAGTSGEDIQALLVTHEHTDHIRSVSAIIKGARGAMVYASPETWSSWNPDWVQDRKRTFEVGEAFYVGDIQVKAFSVSHDAAGPVGFSFRNGGKQISIVTDTGCVNEILLEEITEADILVLEANHDVDMLRMGRYPYFLKQRILGDRGHLSNEAAGKVLVHLLEENTKDRWVLLAHLSRENNFPEMAYQTVKNILEEGNYYIGEHLHLDTIVRDQVSPVYQL